VPRAADTCASADAFQVEVYRRMGGVGRAQVMFRLGAMTRQAVEAGIRRRHPDYDDGQVLRAYARLLHGEDLVVRAWPDHSLVEP
jgi:hypothetical protein